MIFPTTPFKSGFFSLQTKIWKYKQWTSLCTNYWNDKTIKTR